MKNRLMLVAMAASLAGDEAARLSIAPARASASPGGTTSAAPDRRRRSAASPATPATIGLPIDR